MTQIVARGGSDSSGQKRKLRFWRACMAEVKTPNSRCNLDEAIKRAFGADYLRARTAMANAIVDQPLPEGVAEGESALKLGSVAPPRGSPPIWTLLVFTILRCSSTSWRTVSKRVGAGSRRTSSRGAPPIPMACPNDRKPASSYYPIFSRAFSCTEEGFSCL